MRAQAPGETQQKVEKAREKQIKKGGSRVQTGKTLMIMRKESREKQESHFVTRKRHCFSPSPPHQAAVVHAFLLRKDDEKNIQELQFWLLYNFYRIKVKGRLAEVCWNAVCTAIMPGDVGFRAETENRAKTLSWTLRLIT